MHVDKTTFHRFDRFNLKYNPCGQSRLREIFIKQDNLIHGRFLAELTREVRGWERRDRQRERERNRIGLSFCLRRARRGFLRAPIFCPTHPLINSSPFSPTKPNKPLRTTPTYNQTTTNPTTNQTKQVMSDYEQSKYQHAELRVSVYGRKAVEWDVLASWVVGNQLWSNNVVRFRLVFGVFALLFCVFPRGSAPRAPPFVAVVAHAGPRPFFFRRRHFLPPSPPHKKPNRKKTKTKQVWLVQIPRLYNAYRETGVIENFEQMLANLFVPLFEATVNPSSHPQLHVLLSQVVAFDMVDDESKPERRPTKHSPLPQHWTSKHNAAYAYYAYYIYANLHALNQLREARVSFFYLFWGRPRVFVLLLLFFVLFFVVVVFPVSPCASFVRPPPPCLFSLSSSRTRG